MLCCSKVCGRVSVPLQVMDYGWFAWLMSLTAASTGDFKRGAAEGKAALDKQMAAQKK